MLLLGLNPIHIIITMPQRHSDMYYDPQMYDRIEMPELLLATEQIYPLTNETWLQSDSGFITIK